MTAGFAGAAARGATQPLLAHETPDAVVAYRGGEPMSAGRFLSQALHLAAQLPPGRHVLNTCTDRYRFTLGFAASLIAGRVSLLPPTHTPEVIRYLADSMPDVCCLTDEPECGIALPQIPVQESPARMVDWQVPQIGEEQLAAIVFTSGSTGTPLPYRKTWGGLARCIRNGAAMLGLADRGWVSIGTVPPQHMYGFETTVLLPMLTGNAFCAERPFFPVDACSVIAAAPRRRVLITTPVHLRALLTGGVALPPIDLVVSATAPLSRKLAEEAESRLRVPLVEVYGSTETGQIAMRRTSISTPWRLWPDVRLTPSGDRMLCSGGHVEQETLLCDVVETIGEREFLLHGRTTDLVNVAGKRSSLGYLNAQLAAIPGVLDGTFFLPHGATSPDCAVPRLAAAVVAPELGAAELTRRLRERIDPAFLPRPLLLLARLPRNATGKLPEHALQALIAGNALCAPLAIPHDHPAYAGHFPASPVLPGAALLDAVLHEIARARQLDLTGWQAVMVKFLEPVLPGHELHLEHSVYEGAVRFSVKRASRAVASGTLAPTAAASTYHDAR